ncbi:MAG: hypothetical protein Q8R34_02360 [bacterium]|nr:hypothetical protein [bacterium]
MKKLIKNLFKRTKEKETKNKINRIEVKKAAESTFRKYDKTLKDLARYDRGERIFN